MEHERFEWDEAKALSNFTNHGITFHEATSAFDDPDGFEVFDDRRDYGEDRWVRFGRINKRLIIVDVAFGERNERIRIISARSAESDEEAAYFDQF